MANLILGNGEFGQGLKFEARPSGHPLSHGPVYGPAGYVALRNDPTYNNTVYVMTSTDGQTWTEQAHNINLEADQISGLSYINGKYVVYGLENLNNSEFYIRINTSTDGVNWTSYKSANTVNSSSLSVITYANGLWQVFGRSRFFSYHNSWTSPDLLTWTKRIDYKPNDGSTYSWLGGGFSDTATNGSTTIVVGYATAYSDSTGDIIGDETLYFKTTNSTTWTIDNIQGGTTPGGDQWRPKGIAFGNSTWVIVGTSGKVFTSTNATTWTERTSGTTGDLTGVTFSNGVFIALRFTGVSFQNTVEVLRSTNGINWTTLSTPVLQSDDVLYMTNGVSASQGFIKPVYALNKWIVSDYQSTDNGLTWTILDFQVPNKQPFIKYAHESGWNTWKTMDFWAFIPSHPGLFTGMAIASQRGSFAVYFETQISGRLQIDYRGPGLTSALANITNTFVFGEWNHFRLVVENGQASWYLNGTRAATVTTGTRLNASDTLNIGYSAYISESRYARPVDYYIDEFMLSDDALNPTSATSITVPTAPFINTEATSILLHFDTDFNDDPSDPARSGSAAIDSAFSEIIQINAVYKGQAALQANFVEVTAGNAVRGGRANLSTTFVLSTSALDLDLATANISVVSSLTANAGIIKQASSSIDSSTALVVDNGRLIRATGSLEVNAFELVVVARTQQFGAYIEAQSSLTANAIKAADAPTDINATSSLTASVGKLMVSDVAMTVASSMVTVTDKLKSFIITEPVIASLDASATKIARTGAVIACVSNLEFTAANTQAGSGTLFNQCSMTISAQATKRIQLNLPATVEVLAITNNVVRAEADLTVTAFELTIAKAFNLEESAVWVVPVENTQWTIPKDNNDYLITLENREYKI